MKNLFTIFCCFLFTSASYAQGEANNWVFGQNAGVSWNSGVPVAFSGSAMDQWEGVCCISNAAGIMLFYSDGMTVWNRNHQQMPNGFGLMGNLSSTQSAVIVPWPANPSKYFIFTVDAVGGANGFRYSVVDMSLQGGLGDVVAASKNTLLYTPSCEKITATFHSNGTDIWVVSHRWNSNSFYAYLVTSAGVNPIPVITNAGTSHTGAVGRAVGYMKISPDGRKLALVVHEVGFAEFFDFDNTTAQVSNPVYDSYSSISFGPNGLEFSPNSRYVYVACESSSNEIFQYDLLAGSPAAILTSKYVVADSAGATALQLAVDQKIYTIKGGQNFMGAINNPNLPGVACGFQRSAVILTNGSLARYGLPNFVQSYFHTSNDFTVQNTCFGEATAFSVATADADSALWNFGDIASGAANSSTLTNPSHVFTSADTFSITLHAWKNGLVDTTIKQIIIHPLPVVNLGNDTTICNGQSMVLNAAAANGIYLWQNNSTNASQTITQSGTYWVEVTIANCATADTVEVNLIQIPALNLGADTSVCSPNTLALNATTAGAVYHWQDNSSTAIYQATQTGDYSVTVSVSACEARDTIHVTIGSLPPASIVATDTVFCPNNNTQICATAGLAKYSWNIGDSTACITADASGNYFVTVTDNSNCTAASNTVVITINPAPVVAVSTVDNIFCAGDSTEVCATSGFVSYLWNNAKTDSCFQARQAGNYYVTVTDNNGCTASSNHLAVNVYPLPSISISVNGDTLTSYNGVTYQWYRNGNIINGAIDNMYEAKQGGSYTVAITDTNGCSAVSNPVIISGIDNLSPAFSVNVYPNPLDNGFWNVDCATNMLGSLIEIFDADGRLVFESKIIDTNSQIELNAQRGIYMLRISSANSAIVRKLIRL